MKLHVFLNSALCTSDRSTGGPSSHHNDNKNADKNVNKNDNKTDKNDNKEEDDDEIRSDASTEIFAEMEFSTVPSKNKKSAEVQNVQNSSPSKPKKRRGKYLSQNLKPFP